MASSSAITIDTSKQKTMTFPLFMLLFYIIAEYARPGFLSPLRPALLAQIILMLSLLSDKKKTMLVIKERFFKLYFLLLLLMVLHVFIAVNNFWALMQLQVMFSYLIIGVSCCVFIDTTRKLYILLSFFILVMVLCAINRIIGSGFIGVTGPMGDTNDFALAMNVALPISFFLGRTEEGGRKWFFWSASVLFVIANMSCASRGGFLGLAVVGTVCWLYSKQKFKSFLAITVLALIAWNFAAPDFRKEILDIGSESADKDTGKDRVELWKVAWRAFEDNPVLGVGQGNMPIIFGKYQKDESGESYWRRDYFGRAVHSVYFTLLPELGLVGTLIFALMLKEMAKKFKQIKATYNNKNSDWQFRKLESMNIGLLLSLFGFLASGVFLSALYYPEVWNISALIVTLYFISSENEKRLGEYPDYA